MSNLYVKGRERASKIRLIEILRWQKNSKTFCHCAKNYGLRQDHFYFSY